MENLFINYGRKRHHFQLPSDWKLLTFAGFTGKAEERAVGEPIRRALKKPVGALPLKESLSPGKKVAILVEDLTRPSPKALILKVLLEELAEAFIAGFERFHARYRNRLLKGVLEHFNQKRLILPEGAIDFNMALAMTLAVQDKFKTILLSEDIPRETARRMGFHFAENLKEAFAISSRFCPRPEVQVVPSGGVILPELPGGL